MEKKENYLIAFLFVLVIFIIYREKKEHILARPTYFGTMEDVYKAKIKDKKGLDYNDYLIENQFLLNKYMTNKDRIL